MNKVLIIGSNSFSGSHFINYCLNKKLNVIGVSRSKEINNVFLPYKDSKYIKNYSFFKIDLNKDLKKLENLIKENKISHIVNFSSQSMVGQSWDTPEDWYRTNVLSSVKMIEILKNIKTIKKFLHISTPEVYGNITGKKKEAFTYNPSTPYATSRAAFDMHLKNYFESLDFPVLFTRAANVYGPHQQLYRIIPRAIIYPYLNKKLNLDGGGTSARSFIHIDDVCDATFQVLQNGTIGNIYHISTEEFISIKKLVGIIMKKNKFNFNNNVNIFSDRLGKDKKYILSIDKIKKELGWYPKISLNDGIDSVCDWVINNFDLLKRQNLEYKHLK